MGGWGAIGSRRVGSWAAPGANGEADGGACGLCDHREPLKARPAGDDMDGFGLPVRGNRTDCRFAAAIGATRIARIAGSRQRIAGSPRQSESEGLLGLPARGNRTDCREPPPTHPPTHPPLPRLCGPPQELRALSAAAICWPPQQAWTWCGGCCAELAILANIWVGHS